MWRRILAILVARNREFYRDHAGLGWNIFMPILMVLAFAFIFSGPPEDLLKIGVIRGPDGPADAASPFLATRHVTLVPVAAPARAWRRWSATSSTCCSTSAVPRATGSTSTRRAATWPSACCWGPMPGRPRVRPRSGGP